MNKERFTTCIAMILFAYIGLGIFDINAYLVVFLLVCYFAFDYYQGKEKLAKQNELESKELKSEIKTTTRDAHLKHKQLLTMISSIPFPLVLMNAEGKLVLYNSYFNQFRKSDKERELSYIDNDCYRNVAEILKDGYIFEKNFTRIIEHQEKTYEVICLPVKAKGKFSGCVLLFQDISEARERESMQKQFIADASHELKTPISVIKGMIEILNRDDFDDEETEKDFQKQIEKETRRMEIIVRDLLQLSRLSKDNLILKRESCDFTTILDSCVNSFVKIANDKGLKIKKDYQSFDKIFVDRELSMTLMNNLISNAIKYSDSGTITISTREVKEEYMVSIKDEGVGLTPEDKEKIFERFYRVDKARSRESGGSGLGLSIVKSIVEAHGARIEIDSVPKQGTEIKLYYKY